MILMIFCMFMWSGWSRAPQKHQYSYRNINVFSTGPPGTLQVAQELIFPRIMLESLEFSIIWRNSRNSMQLMDFYWIPVILARPGLAWPGQARPIQYTVYSKNPKKKTGIWAPEVPFRLQFFSLRVPVFFLRVLGISSLGAIPPQFFSLRVLEPSSVFI